MRKIKKLLLKLAHKIYKHYNQTIEIDMNDTIKFNGSYFRIISSVLKMEMGYVNTLELKLHDVCESLKFTK